MPFASQRNAPPSVCPRRSIGAERWPADTRRAPRGAVESGLLGSLTSRLTGDTQLGITITVDATDTHVSAVRTSVSPAYGFAKDCRQRRRRRRHGRYINEIGTLAHAQDLNALLGLAAVQGLELEQWYGALVAVDTEEFDPPPVGSGELTALLEVEGHMASTYGFRQLGQLAHLVLRRPPRHKRLPAQRSQPDS